MDHDAHGARAFLQTRFLILLNITNEIFFNFMRADFTYPAILQY